MGLKTNIARLLMAAWALGLALSASAELQVGDAAPDFRLIGSDGEYYTLSQFKGEKPVVIAFFPKAFTGG